MTENNESNLVDIEKYSKDKKRSQQEKIIFFTLIIIFSVVFLLSLFSISPFSKVDDIQASGNIYLTDQEIIDSSQINNETSMWSILLNGSDIKANLIANEPAIEQVDFQFENFNDLIINITEIPTVAYQSVDDVLYPVLENGELIKEEATVTHGNAPILSGFTQDNLQEFIDSYVTLDDSIKQLVSEVHFSPSDSNANRIIFYMSDGNQVYASLNTFANRMSYYLSMTEAVGDTKGIYQLEVGAFFTPFDSADEESVNLESENINTDEESSA